MKRMISQDEYYEIQARISAGLNSEIMSGSTGHIEDHKTVAERLNYLPAVKLSNLEKVGEDEWIMYQEGEEYPTPSSTIDAQYQMFSDYPEMIGGMFSVIDTQEIPDRVGTDSPVGTKVTNYIAGIEAYASFASSEDLDEINGLADQVGSDLSRLEEKVQKLFSVYTYLPDGNGNWVEDIYSPTPEYPLTNIRYAHMLDSDGKVRGDLSFANSTITGPEDLSSVNTADYSAVQIWTWKLSPEDAISRVTDLETQVQDLTARIEALENPTSPE